MNIRNLTLTLACLAAAAPAASADPGFQILAPQSGATVNETPGGSLTVTYAIDWSLLQSGAKGVSAQGQDTDAKSTGQGQNVDARSTQQGPNADAKSAQGPNTDAKSPQGQDTVAKLAKWQNTVAKPVVTLRFGVTNGGASCAALVEKNVPWGSTQQVVPFSEIRSKLTGACAQPDAAKIHLRLIAAWPSNPKPLGEASLDFKLVRPARPDLAVSLDPDFATVWPTKFTVRNLGGSPSEDTILRVKVEVLQGDLDVVKQNCKPRFTDFDEVVSELAPGAPKTIAPPSAIGAIRFRSGFSIQGRPATPTPAPAGSPVQQVVACQFSITAELAQNHNLNDTNRSNDKLARTIHVDVPLK